MDANPTGVMQNIAVSQPANSIASSTKQLEDPKFPMQNFPIDSSLSTLSGRWVPWNQQINKKSCMQLLHTRHVLFLYSLQLFFLNKPMDEHTHPFLLHTGITLSFWRSLLIAKGFFVWLELWGKWRKWWVFACVFLTFSFVLFVCKNQKNCADLIQTSVFFCMQFLPHFEGKFAENLTPAVVSTNFRSERLRNLKMTPADSNFNKLNHS